MRSAALPLWILSVILVVPTFAKAGGAAIAASPGTQGPGVLKNDDPPKNKASVEMEELAKQALATWQAALTLPAESAKWPSIGVNGQTLPPTAAQLVNLYISGEATLLYIKISMALDRELEKAKKAGVDVSHVELTDEQFEKRIVDFKKVVEQQAPDMTWDQYLARNQQSEESFRGAFRTQLMFENYFLPKDDTKWPAVTLESAKALRPGLGEKELAEFLYQVKLANRDPLQASPILVFMLKQQLIKRVVEIVEVKDTLDGVPPGIAMSFDDKTLTAADLYKRGMGLGNYIDFLHAIEFASIREAVRQAIVAREDEDWKAAKDDAAKRRAAGEDIKDPARPVYWLADGSPEFRQAYDAEVKKYGGTPPFDHKGLVRFRRFPTMPIYRMFFQMLESYRRMTAKTRTLEVLAAHVENDALFFNSGQADVESIWYNISADPNKAAIGSFEEAFSVAKARAEKGVADMVEGVRRADEARKKAKAEGKSEVDQEKAAIAAAKGFTFRDVLERDSDYKDPQQKPGQPQSPMLNKRGLFGPQYRNPLSEMMHESELTNLLSGYRFAEDLFFRTPLGQVIGPVRGADGYYVARCLSRTPGPKVTDLKDEKSREFVEDDYVNHAFQDFVNEVMAKSKIEMKN